MWLLTDIKSNVFKAISLFSFHFSKSVVWEKAELASSACLQLIHRAVSAGSWAQAAAQVDLDETGFVPIVRISRFVRVVHTQSCFDTSCSPEPVPAEQHAIYRRGVNGRACYQLSSPSWLCFRSTFVGFSGASVEADTAFPRLQGFSRSHASVHSSLY